MRRRFIAKIKPEIAHALDNLRGATRISHDTDMLEYLVTYCVTRIAEDIRQEQSSHSDDIRREHSSQTARIERSKQAASQRADVNDARSEA